MGKSRLQNYAEQIMDQVTEYDAKSDILIFKIHMKGIVHITRVYDFGREEEVKTTKIEPLTSNERTNVLTKILMILVQKEEHKGLPMCYRLMKGDGPWDYLTYYERDDDDERARQQELSETSATKTERR